MRLVKIRCTKRNIDNRAKRVDLDRWVAKQITKLGTDASWVEEQGGI